MDAATIGAVAQLLKTLGPWGILSTALVLNIFPALLVLGFWWVVEWRRSRLDREGKDERQARERAQADALERLVRDSRAEVDRCLRKLDEQREEHRREVSGILERHAESLRQVTGFYNDNVELVKSFQRLSEDFHTTITLNTQVMQKVCDKIDHNWFCPMIKEKGGKS